jgi:replication-associated recombination protein RarA
MDDKTNEIVVMVYGAPNSGKTSIAQAIEMAIKDTGIAAEFIDEDGTIWELPRIKHILDVLAKNGTRVVIKTHSLARYHSTAMNAQVVSNQFGQ